VIPTEKIKESRGLMIIKGIKSLCAGAWVYLKRLTYTPALEFPKLAAQEKTVVLFALVKLFFLPMMLNFLFENFESFKHGFMAIGSSGHPFSLQAFNQYIFPVMLTFLFFIDVAYFTFGYLGEAGFLKNTVRSVEPTLLGWTVALACYPPFNNTVSNFTSYSPNEYIGVSSQYRTFILHMAILLLLAVYAAASVALGAKASNLTNRGIVSRGPYGWVRHPAYTAKNLAWWVAILPVFSYAAVLSMLLWSSIYFMRAITEERHLLADPEYREYAARVRYRFIPGVW
jgi:protein-S-isoprenylcysteine O-methyltransferase Ste14